METQEPTSGEDITTIEGNLRQALQSAIFIPFKGFDLNVPSETSTSPILPNTVPTLDPASKLEKILELLPQQQDVVRRQMILIILQQIDKLKKKANNELEQLKKQQDISLSTRVEKEREKLERIELEEMLRRVKAPQKQHLNYEQSYDLKPDSNFIDTFRRLPQKPQMDSEGDIEMIGGGLTSTIPRTERQVKEQLAQDMQILIRSGMQELDNYDKHCRAVMQPYQSSRARRSSGVNTTQATSSGLSTDPNVNLIASQIVNMGLGARSGLNNDVGRLSNGMPVSMERHPARKIESLGELTRRSKK